MAEKIRRLNKFDGFWSYGFSFIIFIILAVVFFVASGGYEESFLLINRKRSGFLDIIVPYLTHIGSFLSATAIIFIVFAKKPANAINGFLILAISGLIIVFLKNVFFHEFHRPVKVFFERETVFTLAESPIAHNSFPSGHSTTFSALMSVLAFSFAKNNKFLAVVLAILNIALSLTRTYLGLHFLGDIIVGTVIGFAVSVAFLALFQEKLEQKFKKIKPKTQKIWTTSFYIFGIIALAFSISIFNYGN